MGRARETTKRVSLMCVKCNTKYEGEAVMKSRSVPGVMGPVGEMLKNAVDNCPECGSYNVRLRNT